MNMETAPEQALAWHKSGLGAVIATVIETWGSAPRRVGAQVGCVRHWRNDGICVWWMR